MIKNRIFSDNIKMIEISTFKIDGRKHMKTQFLAVVVILSTIFILGCKESSVTITNSKCLRP